MTTPSPRQVYIEGAPIKRPSTHSWWIAAQQSRELFSATVEAELPRMMTRQSIARSHEPLYGG